MTVSPAALAALTSIELREAELLAWGAASAQWTEQEILELVSGHGPGRPLFDELLDTALLVRTPQGGYRTPGGRDRADPGHPAAVLSGATGDRRPLAGPGLPFHASPPAASGP